MAKGKSNGADRISAPTEYVDFMIGKEPVRINALTLYDLELIHDPLFEYDANLDWIQSAGKILDIIVILRPGLNREELAKRMLAGESLEIQRSFNDLLRISGFRAGEAQAAVETSGTGTSMPLPPNSQDKESAAVTLTE